jgi:hypothetical protein
MSAEPRQLEQIERWMRAVIMHPDGVVAGIHSADARAEIEIESSDLDRVVEPSLRLSSLERLKVYGNAYYARLLDCLREEFPALKHAVGDEAFDALAFGYLQACPSNSYTLARLGERFPGYLSETRPPREVDSPEPDWPQFMVDLATLERTYSEVFDGPGVEGLPLLTVDELRTIPSDRWEDVSLQTVPCLRLLEFHFPVHNYATAVKQGDSPEFPEAGPVFLAISRREYIVRRWELEPAEFRLLQFLQSGMTLGEAIQTVADSEMDPASSEDFANRLQGWFTKWSAAGLFASVRSGAS